MGVVSRYNKGKKKTNLSLGAGEGRGEGRESVREGKVASCLCCLQRCGDAAPRHHIMTIIGLVGSVGYNACHMLSNQYLMHQCSTLVDCTYFY